MPCFNVSARLILLLACAGTGSITLAVADAVGAPGTRAAIETTTAATATSMHTTGAGKATKTPSLWRETATRSAASWGPVQIVIYKSKRSMALYRFGNFDKEYPVVLGPHPEGRKRYADDARTPEGLYHIVSKRPHRRWQYFLALDYPNADDRKAYEEEVREGRIPDEDGEPFGIGDSVGIHGNDRQAEQAAGVNWTKGCIALSAADIAELAAIVPLGTPVWIVE